MIKKLLIITALVSTLLIGAGIVLAQSSTEEVDLIADYHVKANEIINEQFENLFTFFDEIDIEDENYLAQIQEKLTVPEDLESCSTNLTSTCLLYRLNNELDGLRLDLDEISETTSTSLQYRQQQLSLIQALNTQSVEFYGQTLFAYPIHIQNERLLEGLKEMRTNLKELERNLQPYSNVFHNVATTQCR